jgi:hypothetical protein
VKAKRIARTADAKVDACIVWLFISESDQRFRRIILKGADLEQRIARRYKLKSCKKEKKNIKRWSRTDLPTGCWGEMNEGERMVWRFTLKRGGGKSV